MRGRVSECVCLLPVSKLSSGSLICKMHPTPPSYSIPPKPRGCEVRPVPPPRTLRLRAIWGWFKGPGGGWGQIQLQLTPGGWCRRSSGSWQGLDKVQNRKILREILFFVVFCFVSPLGPFFSFQFLENKPKPGP